MMFEVENLGPIKTVLVNLNKDLVILSGENNTGKTYLLTAIGRNINKDGNAFIPASIVSVQLIKSCVAKESPFAYLADELDKIMGAKISVTGFGEIRFVAPNLKHPLEIGLAGSMIKSLTGLSFFLRYLANKNDCIIIDNPESGLHPDNQRKIARFLGRLINEGFKVIISTHSDYIIKEINNLVMLSKESEVQKYLLQKYNYPENELIKPERIEALLFRKSADGRKIIPTKIDVDETGFLVETIDEVINDLNDASEDIYFQLFEK